MDYQVKRNDGKLIWYKLIGHSVIPVEVKMHQDGFIITDLLIFAKRFGLKIMIFICIQGEL